MWHIVGTQQAGTEQERVSHPLPPLPRPNPLIWPGLPPLWALSPLALPSPHLEEPSFLSAFTSPSPHVLQHPTGFLATSLTASVLTSLLPESRESSLEVPVRYLLDCGLPQSLVHLGALKAGTASLGALSPEPAQGRRCVPLWRKQAEALASPKGPLSEALSLLDVGPEMGCELRDSPSQRRGAVRSNHRPGDKALLRAAVCSEGTEGVGNQICVGRGSRMWMGQKGKEVGGGGGFPIPTKRRSLVKGKGIFSSLLLADSKGKGGLVPG